MAAFDITVNGVSAKLRNDGESNGYSRRTIRTQVESNLLSQAENPLLTSRTDQRQLYQSDWSGGARWWKPLVSTDMSSYFQANHMDLWSEPGKVVPGNLVVDAANTSIHINCVIGAGEDGEVYAIGDTANVNASFYDVYLWTPASDAFVQETGYHSGVPINENPVAMVHDPSDGYFYVMNDTGNEITRFNPVTPADDPAYVANTITRVGNIFLTQDGIVYYNGNTLILLDKTGTPAGTNIVNDGLGFDILGSVSLSGPLLRRLRLAIGTPGGIYYVKNTYQSGQVLAYVFRADRDAAGNWIGNPIATLPMGSVALEIAYHMGSVVITACPDLRSVLTTTDNKAEVVIYHITQNSLGALGSPLGGRDELDEAPLALLGSNGNLLYIGGHKRLWVHDAVRGGLHTAWEWPTALSNGPYAAMAWVDDSDGDPCMIFLGADRIARVKTTRTDDPDIVSAFGDDESHYVLTSNFFDMGLPLESKEITKVAIMRDASTTANTQEWTVQISADGGAFADVLTHSTTDEYKEADLSGTSGRLFQYKLIYQTKDTLRKALRSLLVTANTGEMVTEWSLVLDGESLMNVGNAPVRPDAFYNSMVTLAGTSTQIDFVDNFQDSDQADTSSIKVKVQAVEILKDAPGEATVRVVLREP